jgi:MFS family permease
LALEPGTAQYATAKHVRTSLIAMFGVFGVVVTAWGGRMPAIRSALGMTDGEIGSIIVLGAIGSLISVAFVGAVIPRIGSRATLTIGNWLAMLGMVILGIGVLRGSVPVFAVGIFLNGVSNPFANATSNLEGARVEKMLGHAVLPQLHAAFPVGAALGAVIAAITAHLHIHAGWHVIGIALVCFGVRILLIPPATELQDEPLRALPKKAAAKSAPGVDAPAAETTSGSSIGSGTGVGAGVGTGAGAGASTGTGTVRAPYAVRAAWTESRTLLIGIVLLAATASEGAASNWLNLGVVDGFDIPDQYGALAYGTFVISMLIVRVFGAGLITRHGRVPVLYVCGGTALTGLLLFSLAPTLPLAWLGIILWGMGAAMAWPVAMAAAADDPYKAAARVSVVSTFSSISMLGAPPLLGMLADSVGIRRALLALSVLMILSLAVARIAREERVDEPVS